MSATNHDNTLCIVDDSLAQPQAEELAKQLQLPLIASKAIKQYPHIAKMLFIDGQWRIQLPNSKTLVSVDFADSRLLARSQSQALNKEHIVRAVLGRKKPQQPLTVLDATAGFGQDSFLLASAGCELTLIEQIPLLAYLLKQAVMRAGDPVASQMTVINDNSVALMQRWTAARPAVIYLDPMYAHSSVEQGVGLKKTAAVKKNMAFLQYLTDPKNNGLADDADLYGDGMIEAALALAASKVVVKRAPGAQWLGNVKPASSIEGKSARFDIYPTNNN